MLSIQTEFISGISLNIDLNQNVDFTPKSESIKKYIDYEVETVLDESLLEDRDEEYVSFLPSLNYFFYPYFNDKATYTAAGFEPKFITGDTTFKDESFYLFDLYDNFNDVNQRLISRNFLKMSKIVTTEDKTEIDFTKKFNKEYINIYIPSYFMNTTADTFYLKISFFNSTNGRLRFFECSSNENGSLKNYFKLKINKSNKTYEILNGNLLTSLNTFYYYKLIEVIESNKEALQTFGNTLSGVLPIIKEKTIITTRGKLI
jgi:hypothetical protein